MAKQYTGKSKNWHIECYNRITGKQSQPRGRSLWQSTCDVCKGLINPGDLITWSTSPITEPISQDKLPERPITTPAPAPATPTPTPTPTPVTKPWNPNDIMSNMAQGVLPYLEGRIGGRDGRDGRDGLDAVIDWTRIEDRIRELSIQVHRHVVDIRMPDGKLIECGIQHKMFGKLMQLVALRTNIWVTGPTGSGKTTAAKHVAEQLGLSFWLVPACDTKYDLTGYTDANGKIVRTAFREAWEHGGVCLWDEVDSWNPSATLAGNAVANSVFSFPDKMVPRHPDFVLIAAANTWGYGATDDYVGRNKLDKAFLNRFTIKLDWDYDEDLEVAMSGNVEWTKRVQTLRANAKRQGLKTIISPRVSIEGAKLLAAGFTQADVELLTVKPGLTDAQWSSIR